MSAHPLLITLVVGLVAGWLAGTIVRGSGFGLIGDVAIGIIGAFVGNWLLLQLGIHLASGIVGSVLTATVGAVVLLLVVGLLRGRRRWYDGGWRGSRRFW